MLDAKTFLSDLNIYVNFALVWCMWRDLRIECIQVDHDSLQCISWFKWNINHESIRFWNVSWNVILWWSFHRSLLWKNVEYLLAKSQVHVFILFIFSELDSVILDDSIEVWNSEMILLVDIFHIFHEDIESVSVHEFVSSVFDWQRLEINVWVTFAFSYSYMINWELDFNECFLWSRENFVNQKSHDDSILQINICLCSFCSKLNEKFSILDHDLHQVFCDVYDSFDYFILNQHMWNSVLRNNVNWWVSIIQDDFKFRDVVTAYWEKFDIAVKLYTEFSFSQSIWCIESLLQRNASSLSEVIVNYL